MVKKQVDQVLKKKNPASKVDFINGQWVEVPPARVVEIQKEIAALRAAGLIRHERLRNNLCPRCETVTPKHERLRPCTVNCSKCNHLYTTYPGV